MATETPTVRSKADLIGLLDSTMDEACPHSRCDRVKEILSGAFKTQELKLPDRFHQPVSEGYARRLLHKDPAGRYSVVVMVWGPNQKTPLHDHAGTWCVECVCCGRIRIDSYDLVGRADDQTGQFVHEQSVLAGVGEAGALIPPFEYHVLANAQDEPSVTIHVYGEELKWCNIFVPVDGGYHKERKPLGYVS